MEPVKAADQFLECLAKKYPAGSNRVEAEILNLKRKLDLTHDEFSDCDENEMIRELENVEIEQAAQKKPKLNFACDICGKTLKQKYNKVQHMKTHCASFNCVKCEKSFSRDYIRKQHEPKCTGNLTSNNTSKLTCKHCRIPFDTYEILFQHVVENHPLTKGNNERKIKNTQHKKVQEGGDISQTPQKEPLVGAINSDKKFNRYVRKGALNDAVYQTDIISEREEKYDLLQFFANTKLEIEDELHTRQERVRDIKWYLNVRVEMVREIANGSQEKTTPHFRSKTYTSLQNDDNDHDLNEAFQKINASLEEFIHKGSNWVVNKVISLEINTVRYSPISGSSYMELPSKVRLSNSIINIKHDDQKCFLWSVLAAIHPTQNNAERVSNYKDYEHSLNLKYIEFPVSLSKVQKCEKQNNLSINIFGYEDDQVFPLYLTKMRNTQTEINLLYLSGEEHSHYCWIKNLSHFLGHTHKTHRRLYYCHRCLHGFIRRDLLDAHRPYCERFDFQKVEYPKEEKNDILQFRDHQKAMKVAFAIYSDFEALACKIDTCLPNPDIASTTHQTKFEACGYAYQVVCTNNKYTKPPVVHRGNNVVEHFFDDMFKEEEYINEILGDIEPLIMTEETENAFKNATHCYICSRMFTDKRIKVRDHAHIGVTGDAQSPRYSNFRGAACQSCNLNRQDPTFIPILFHNLKNFDSHLLIEAAGKYKDKKKYLYSQ